MHNLGLMLFTTKKLHIFFYLSAVGVKPARVQGPRKVTFG